MSVEKNYNREENTVLTHWNQTYKYDNATRNVLVIPQLTFVTIFNQKHGSDHKGYLQTLVTNRVRQTALLRAINCGGYKLN